MKCTFEQLQRRSSHNLLESPEISSTQEIPEEGEEDLEEEEEEGEIGQEDGEGPTLLHPHVRIFLRAHFLLNQCHSHFL